MEPLIVVEHLRGITRVHEFRVHEVGRREVFRQASDRAGHGH